MREVFVEIPKVSWNDVGGLDDIKQELIEALEWPLRPAKDIIRNIDKEKQIESQITKILRETFSFEYIPLEGQETRIGREGLESRLIGTISCCSLCQPSKNWLGKYSLVPEIRNGKLWLSQYLHSTPLTEQDKTDIVKAIQKV